MEDNTNPTAKSIHELVQVIKDKGEMTQDDHTWLNSMAVSHARSLEDIQAISDLTQLINQGKVTIS